MIRNRTALSLETESPGELSHKAEYPILEDVMEEIQSREEVRTMCCGLHRSL